MKNMSHYGYTPHHFSSGSHEPILVARRERSDLLAGSKLGLPSTTFVTKSGAGYTLVEIMVTIAIITIMTAIFVGSYSFGKNFDTLKAETQRLSAVLRNARIRDFNGIVQYANGVNAYPPGGFGIHIENNYKVCDGNSNISCTIGTTDCDGHGSCGIASNRTNYILFADVSNNGLYDGGKTGSEFVSEYKLPTGLTIKRDVSGSPTAIDQLNIFFKGSFLSLYTGSGGTWTQLFGSSPSLYVVPSDCTRTQNKIGFVNVSSSTPSISISDQLITRCP